MDTNILFFLNDTQYGFQIFKESQGGGRDGWWVYNVLSVARLKQQKHIV